jgi:hypothetical protein
MAGKKMTLSIPHRLTQEEARRRVENGVTSFRNQFGAHLAQVDERWTGNHMDFTFSVAGQSVSGCVDVFPDKVSLEIDLPWIFAMIADRLRGRIQQEGRKMLE